MRGLPSPAKNLYELHQIPDSQAKVGPNPENLRFNQLVVQRAQSFVTSDC
jgi:hypothetical protein